MTDADEILRRGCEQSGRVGFVPDPGSRMEKLGQELCTAALAYRDEFAKNQMLSAVVWASYPNGMLVIVTRGEYRNQLMENIPESVTEAAKEFTDGT